MWVQGGEGVPVKQFLLQFPTARRLIYPVKPTSQDVKEFWDYMCSRHDVTIIRKDNSEQMKLVAEILNAMGVLNRHEFLKHYTTGVPLRPFRGIYTPFEVGVPNEDYDLWAQMVVCVHEIDHIIQADGMGDLGYSWDYLTNSASRAHHEAGGYRCNMEMWWRYRGVLLDPYVLSVKLIHYNCSILDCEITEKELRLCIPVIRTNVLIELASKEAAVWLDERYGRAA